MLVHNYKDIWKTRMCEKVSVRALKERIYEMKHYVVFDNDVYIKLDELEELLEELKND